MIKIDSDFSLTDFIAKSAVIYSRLDETIGTVVDIFVEKLLKLIETESKTKKNMKFDLDGRRAGMIKRNILAVRAIDLAIAEQGENYIPFSASALNALRHSFPIGVGTSTATTSDHLAVVEHVFGLVKKLLDDSEELKVLNSLYTLISSPNALDRLKAAFDPNFDKVEQIYGWKTIMDEVSAAVAGNGFSAVPFLILARENKHKGSVGADVVAKMATYIRSIHNNITNFANDSLSKRVFAGTTISDSEFTVFKKIVEDADRDTIKLAIAFTNFSAYLHLKKQSGGTTSPLSLLNNYFLDCETASSITAIPGTSSVAAEKDSTKTKAASKTTKTTAKAKTSNNP